VLPAVVDEPRVAGGLPKSEQSLEQMRRGALYPDLNDFFGDARLVALEVVVIAIAVASQDRLVRAEHPARPSIVHEG